MKTLFTLIFVCILAVSGDAFAAVSANLTAASTTTTINKPVNFNVAFLNGGSSQLTVTNVKLTATSSANVNTKLPAAFSVWNQGPNASVTVSAGPNVSTSFGAGQIVFFSPSTGITGSGTATFQVGGTIYTSDGSVTPITKGASVTVNPIPLPSYERQ